MNAKFARLVRSRSNYAAFATLATYDHGFTFKGIVKQFFDRDEERVHINVEDCAGKSTHAEAIDTGAILLLGHYGNTRKVLPGFYCCQPPRLPCPLIDADIFFCGLLPGKILLHPIAHDVLPEYLVPEGLQGVFNG